MSSYATNVARWNAIPMARESLNSTIGTKRSRSRSKSRSASPVLKLQGEYDSSDEDNTSLVSRSPSPSVEKMDVATYDEHLSAPEKEVITVETKIKSTNKGYAILAKLGWTAGQPLGLSGEGRVDPIPFSVKNDSTGLGRRAQDERMIETTVSQRRELDSERQIKETFEQRQTREQKAAEKEALKSHIASTLRPFYCALCDKQYQTVAQYDEHTNSYAHHHKQRFKDMQANAKGIGGGKQDKEARLAKERKREEKELKRMAKAQGVKMGAIGSVTASTLAPVNQPPEEKQLKNAGWATISAPASVANNAPKKSGWATISGNTTPNPPAPNRSGTETSSRTSGFRAAGYETLETTLIPPSTSGNDGSGGLGTIGAPASSRTSGWAPISHPPVVPPSPPSLAPPPPPLPPDSAPQPPPPPSYSPRHDVRSHGSHVLLPRYPPDDRPPSPRSALPGRSSSSLPSSRELDRQKWLDSSRYQNYRGEYRR